jgi:hypothetical protein
MYNSIVNKQVPYPHYLSEEAIKLLKGLLHKDPTKRMGYKFGVEEVKQSEFLQGIEWDRLLKKKYTCSLGVINDLKS